MSNIDNRYHVCCSMCGLVTTCSKKATAMHLTIGHMHIHPATDTITIEAFDSMAKNGRTITYAARIHEGVKSHGFFVPSKAVAA